MLGKGAVIRRWGREAACQSEARRRDGPSSPGARDFWAVTCEALLHRGWHVTCLDNFLTGTPQNLAEFHAAPGFELVHCDVTENMHVRGEVDLILHFASPASPVDYLELPIQTLRVGAVGTERALALARDKGARFVLASTSEVYGDPQVHPQPEEYWGHVNPIGPRGVYDEAKRFAEALVTAYRKAYGVDAGIIRIFNTYGPRMRPHDGRAIPSFIRQGLRGEPVTVAGDGSQTRSVCYVDDLVAGILSFALSGHEGPVNLGNLQEISILQIATDVIAATGGRSDIRFVQRPVDDPQVRRPDTTRATRVLGWRPQVTWADGLRRTVAWYANHSAPAAPVQALPGGGRGSMQ